MAVAEFGLQYSCSSKWITSSKIFKYLYFTWVVAFYATLYTLYFLLRYIYFTALVTSYWKK